MKNLRNVGNRGCREWAVNSLRTKEGWPCNRESFSEFNRHSTEVPTFPFLAFLVPGCNRQAQEIMKEKREIAWRFIQKKARERRWRNAGWITGWMIRNQRERDNEFWSFLGFLGSILWFLQYLLPSPSLTVDPTSGKWVNSGSTVVDECWVVGGFPLLVQHSAHQQKERNSYLLKTVSLSCQDYLIIFL